VEDLLPAEVHVPALGAGKQPPAELVPAPEPVGRVDSAGQLLADGWAAVLLAIDVAVEGDFRENHCVSVYALIEADDTDSSVYYLPPETGLYILLDLLD